jgi:hypothetical protein
MKQTNLLNNYILVIQPYGKCKESYTSVRRTAHKILFIIGRRIPKMPHVEGDDDGVGYGVYGNSSSGNGVYGLSQSTDGYGVVGENKSSVGYGVYGKSKGGNGVYGNSNSGNGVYGNSNSGNGVYGNSSSGNGVYGASQTKAAVVGVSYDDYGVVGVSSNLAGLYGESGMYYAAILNGNVKITGNLEKAGGSFKIDHPLDPANKYLCHSFVESPDMKNVYDGVVVLDEKGEAEIELPDWFGILNKDFRYQLTAIGSPGPNLYIAEEIISETTITTTKHDGSHHDNDGYDDSGHNDNDNKNNNGSRFKIAGGTSAMKVSWQVTGIRKDPWANTHRVQVVENKPAKERGYYIHPDLYGQPTENQINHFLFPEQKKSKSKGKKKNG